MMNLRQSPFRCTMAACYPTAIIGSIFTNIISIVISNDIFNGSRFSDFLTGCLLLSFSAIPFLWAGSSVLMYPLIRYFFPYKQNRLFLFSMVGLSIGMTAFILATCVFLEEQITNLCLKGITPTLPEVRFWLLTGSIIVFYPTCIGMFAALYANGWKIKPNEPFGE